MALRVIRLPYIFVRDRLDRDLDCGEVDFKGNVALVECDDATLADMKSDAEYQGWFTDMPDRSIPNSARRAFRKMQNL